jgi:hypothetical protein
MEENLQTLIDKSKTDKNRLPMSDDLATEEGVRKIIQALKLAIDDLLVRVKKLEINQIK